MNWMREALAAMPPADVAAGDAVRARAADILRPAGALQRLDDLAAWVADWQRTDQPAVHRPVGLIFAADHGVAAAGVSKYPVEVTGAMLAVDDFALDAVREVAGVCNVLKTAPAVRDFFVFAQRIGDERKRTQIVF